MSSVDEPATTVAAKTIKAINTDTVHKICSGQVKCVKDTQKQLQSA